MTHKHSSHANGQHIQVCKLSVESPSRTEDWKTSPRSTTGRAGKEQASTVRFSLLLRLLCCSQWNASHCSRRPRSTHQPLTTSPVLPDPSKTSSSQSGSICHVMPVLWLLLESPTMLLMLPPSSSGLPWQALLVLGELVASSRPLSRAVLLPGLLV